MKNFIDILGLGEERCRACMAPFTPPPRTEATSALLLKSSFCPACLEAFVPQGEKACPLCGLEIPSGRAGQACGACLQSPPPWAEFYCIGPYEGLLSELILRLKFSADFSAGNFLGEMLAVVLSGSGGYDLLAPMPIHPSRLLQRGYNQCRELARPIASRLKLKVDNNILRRKKATQPQAGLSARERAENVKQAFHCAPLKGARVLLVDDILTTGATMRAAAEAMLRGGASSVTVAVAARTPLERQGADLT